RDQVHHPHGQVWIARRQFEAFSWIDACELSEFGRAGILIGIGSVYQLHRRELIRSRASPPLRRSGFPRNLDSFSKSELLNQISRNKDVLGGGHVIALRQAKESKSLFVYLKDAGSSLFGLHQIAPMRIYHSVAQTLVCSDVQTD